MLTRNLLLYFFIFTYSSLLAQPTDTLPNSITFTHEQNHFDKQFANPWYLTSLQVAQREPFGVLIGRINYANRYATNGFQFEAEAYPKLGKKMYAYVSAGYSPDLPVFSKWRTGVSLFIPFARTWEAEAGFRQLYFDKSIWVGTAGASKYIGNWLINARTFYSFTNSNDFSVFVTTRKYLRNEQDYLWLQVGKGISPDESRSIQLNESQSLTSYRINTGIKYSLSRKLQLQLSVLWSQDNYLPGIYGNQYGGSAGLEFKFR